MGQREIRKICCNECLICAGQAFLGLVNIIDIFISTTFLTYGGEGNDSTSWIFALNVKCNFMGLFWRASVTFISLFEIGGCFLLREHLSFLMCLSLPLLSNWATVISCPKWETSESWERTSLVVEMLYGNGSGEFFSHFIQYKHHAIQQFQCIALKNAVLRITLLDVFLARHLWQADRNIQWRSI